MPAPDRDRMTALYKKQPDAFLFLPGVTTLDAAEAAALSQSKARFHVADALTTLDEATAAAYAKAHGHAGLTDALR